MEETTKSRVRLGFKPTTKGAVSLDVTAEAATAAEADGLLREGISRFRKIATEEGFTVVEGA
jgi:hypothetical protein